MIFIFMFFHAHFYTFIFMHTYIYIHRYNFGTSPDLLFKPCDLDNEDLEIGSITQNDTDQCYIDDNGNLYAYDPIIRLPTYDNDDDDDNTHFLHSGTNINDFDSADSDMHSGGGNFDNCVLSDDI
jgi:hypothetical protein